MSEQEEYLPEGYLKISKKYAVYYVALHHRSESKSHAVVGIGGRFPDIILEPSDALTLLTWLEENKARLEQLAKEQEQQ